MACALVLALCLIACASNAAALRYHWGVFQPAVRAQIETFRDLERARAALKQQSFIWQDRKDLSKVARKELVKGGKSPARSAAKAPQKPRAPLAVFRCAGSPSAARLDLPLALRASRPEWRGALAALIAQLYSSAPFFQRALKRRPDLLEHLLDEMRDRLLTLEQNSTEGAQFLAPDADWIVQLKPLDSELAAIFCHMVEGDGEIPSLREHISMKSLWRETRAKIKLQRASFALRCALLGEDLAKELEFRGRQFLADRRHFQSQWREGDYRLPEQIALKGRESRNLLIEILRERGLNKADIPLFAALDFSPRCGPASGADLVVGISKREKCRVIHPIQLE